MRVTKFGILLGSVVAMSLQSASAGLVDITIADPFAAGQNVTNGDKYFGTGNKNDAVNAPSGYREDNETEYNSTADQTWDLEGFVLNNSGGKSLSIVSGFDMKSGNASGATGGNEFEIGDIFIRINNNIASSNSGPKAGYDFVIRITESLRNVQASVNGADWIAPVAYDVFAASQVKTISSTTGETGGSGAVHSGLKWYASAIENGQTAIYSSTPGGASYADNLTKSQLVTAGYTGYGSGGGANEHDVLANISLSWLSNYVNNGDTVYFYTALQCGNDVLSGKFTVPDSGSTVLLGGLALGTLGLARRRFQK